MLNFDLPMKQISIPAEERYTKTENDIISKFTVQSMENELNWSLGETQPPPPESLFLLVGEDLWHDPQLVNNTRPGSLERVIERRAMVQDAVGQAPSCRVVIITLGLAEAWFDHETSLYLNTAPPQPPRSGASRSGSAWTCWPMTTSCSRWSASTPCLPGADTPTSRS